MQARCVVSGKDWHAWVEVTRSRGAEIERCAKTRLGAILRVCPDGRNLKPRRLPVAGPMARALRQRLTVATDQEARGGARVEFYSLSRSVQVLIN